MTKHLKADELAEKWADYEVQLPKIPFFLINLYQFTMPILFLIGLDVLIVYLYSIFHLSILIQIILLPPLAILNVYLNIWFMSKLCKILHNYWNKKSTPEETVYSRKFEKGNVADPAVHYYHLRGFMYKWPVWVAKKSFFPWMVNFVLVDLAGNKLHKNSLYGDCYVSLEFTELNDQAVVMEGCCISSHVVDSIYGNLTLQKVSVKERGVMHATAVMAPGGVIGEDVAVAPHSFILKRQVVDQNESKFIWGCPAKKYQYYSFLDLLPPAYHEQWKKKQLVKKSKKNK